jgi:hypothetical protein
MIRFTLIALFTFAGGMARAADPAADAVKELQGEWQVIEIQSKGQKVTKDDAAAKNMRFVIQGRPRRSTSLHSTGRRWIQRPRASTDWRRNS